MSAPVTIFYQAASVNNAYIDGIALAQEVNAGVPLVLRNNETANTPFDTPYIPLDLQAYTDPNPYIFYDQFRQVLATSTGDLSAINFVITYIDRLGVLKTFTQPGPNAETVSWMDADGNPLLGQRIISIIPQGTAGININIGYGSDGQTNFMLMDYMRAYWNTTVEVYVPATLTNASYNIYASSVRINNPQTNGTVAPPPYLQGFLIGTANAVDSQRVEVPMTTATLWVEISGDVSPFNATELYVTFLQQGVR